MLQSCLGSFLSQTVPCAGVTVLHCLSGPQWSLARHVLCIVESASPGGVPRLSSRTCGLAGVAVWTQLEDQRGSCGGCTAQLWAERSCRCNQWMSHRPLLGRRVQLRVQVFAGSRSLFFTCTINFAVKTPLLELDRLSWPQEEQSMLPVCLGAGGSEALNPGVVAGRTGWWLFPRNTTLGAGLGPRLARSSCISCSCLSRQRRLFSLGFLAIYCMWTRTGCSFCCLMTLLCLSFGHLEVCCDHPPVLHGPLTRHTAELPACL